MDWDPATLARLIDLDLPEACVPGVEANLAALAQHWRTVEGFVLPEAEE